jgi:cytochrome b6-f complex iron-sulfur subunit
MADNGYRKDDRFSRRDVGRLVVGGVAASYAGAIAYPMVRYLASPPGQSGAGEVSEVALEAADAYQPGSAVLFRFGRKPALLLRRRDGEFVALLATCTHLGCTVQYQAPPLDRIFCACHGGVYEAATGRNVSGPPPRPLERLAVEVASGTVVVRRVGAA